MTERKAWTTNEDEALKELYENRGVKKWAEISRILEKEYNIHNRSGKQCRQRYHNHLDSAIKHQKWTPQEENQLLELHNTLGNHWAEISRAIEGRSQNCVKNQFYSILRRGLRKINKLIREKLKRFKELEIGLLYKIVQNCELTESIVLSKNQMSSMELKREIAFFGMNDIQEEEANSNRVKKIIENVKLLGKTTHKKKPRWIENKPSIEKEKDSEEIESEEYRDNCKPLLEDVKFRRSSFYSFKLENDDKHEMEQFEVKNFGLPLSQPPSKRRDSLQSIESVVSPRIDVPSPKFGDLFSTEGIMEFASDHNRATASPQATLTCDSPYFDQYRSTWYNYYQH